MNIMDIARAVSENAELHEIGIRPGEKLHEQMIAEEESRDTFDCMEHYAIVPDMSNARLWYEQNYKKVSEAVGINA